MKKILLKNIEKVHTTSLGVQRIKKNLKLDSEDVVKYCISVIENEKSFVIKKGKNFYVYLDDKEITVNSSSFTIITAHIKRVNDKLL